MKPGVESSFPVVGRSKGAGEENDREAGQKVRSGSFHTTGLLLDASPGGRQGSNPHSANWSLGPVTKISPGLTFLI